MLGLVSGLRLVLVVAVITVPARCRVIQNLQSAVGLYSADPGNYLPLKFLQSVIMKSYGC